MLFSSNNGATQSGGTSDLDTLVRHIGRLVRHPAYRRSNVVSAILLRHLPMDAGYAWQGEAGLRDRLSRSKLDSQTIGHLVGSVQAEYTRLRRPAEV